MIARLSFGPLALICGACLIGMGLAVAVATHEGATLRGLNPVASVNHTMDVIGRASVRPPRLSAMTGDHVAGLGRPVLDALSTGL